MTKYLFLRHAEADPAENDHERPLSARGIKQAQTCKLIYYPCDLIVTSTAKRAVQTADIIRNRRFPNAPVEHVKPFYIPQKNPDAQTVLKLIEENKEANLNQLLAKDLDGAWKRYCNEALTALNTLVKKHKATHVFIVAHANIINDVALQIDPEAGELRALFFAPCTGFLIEPHHQVEFIF